MPFLKINNSNNKSLLTNKLMMIILLLLLHQTKVQCFSNNNWKFRKGYNTIAATSAVQLKNDHTDNDEQITKSLYPNLCIIGICGSIGSGKSYTSSLLVSKLNEMLQHSLSNGDNNNDDDESNMFAFHIDTDSLAHGVYTPGSIALKEIEYEFGKEVIQDDGTVDRKVLGSIVFSDENQMEKLEQIVWPHVKTLLLERLHQIEKGNINNRKTIVVVEAAVLLDANWDDNHLFDAIWVVRSPSNVSAERLVKNRGMDKDDALKRMEAQVSRRGIGNLKEEVENGTVTAIIENNGSSNSSSDNGSDILWDTLRQYLQDPKFWKAGRCPRSIFDDNVI